MKRISDKSKEREYRGTGTGRNYKSYIRANEFSSLGTCSNPVDWKTGRTVELLSQGEAMLWHQLRWDDNVEDIREQFKLDLERTVAIAEAFKIRHPGGKLHPMTTDFLVTYRDTSQAAISLKAAEDTLSDRDCEKLLIEKVYWMSLGIPYRIIFKDTLNPVLYNNIRQVVEYFDRRRVNDPISAVKHLIATKKLDVDMESAPLDFPALVKSSLTCM